MGKTIKITLEEAKKEFVSRGYIPLFYIYENNYKRLSARTKEGYKISIS